MKEQFINFDQLPKGEIIWKGGVQLPDFDTRGHVNFLDGVFLLGGFHIGSGTYHIAGECEFNNMRGNLDVEDFLSGSRSMSYYCGQNLDIIKRYRKELNFASELVDIETSLIRLKGQDPSQLYFNVWQKVRDGLLKYKKDGIVHQGIQRASINRNDMSPGLHALGSLLFGLERSLYNDERFDGIF